MRWTCPKCGKRLEISNEQLIANDGVIVCPQCLLQAHQPIPKARITSRQEKPATPPPVKTRMKQTPPARRSAALTDSNSSNGSSGTRPSTSKNTSKKRSSKKKKKKQQGMTAWGCLGRTVVFTLVLFAAYVFFGLLLEALQ